MKTQVDHTIEAFEKLTELIRSSWKGYKIPPEKKEIIDAAVRDTQAEYDAIDFSSLSPGDVTRLRRAHEEYEVRTNPGAEQERRRAGGREF